VPPDGGTNGTLPAGNAAAGCDDRGKGMQDAIWHYSDRTGQQVGPVTAETVRGALRTGDIGPDSRFWREGLAGWVGLGAVAAELGVDAPSADPYAAPTAPTDDAVVDWRAGRGAEVVPGGFVRRWAAYILDSLILGVGFSVLSVGFSVLIALASRSDSSLAVFAVFGMYALYFAMAGFYYASQESSVHQATLGKRALGIKVTDLDGRRLSFGHALGRWFAAALSYLTMYIGFLMALFTERKRALHDLVAGTQVVDRWAYTDRPDQQKRELSGGLIALVVALLVIPVMVVAIFAAIAISQYQDYVNRAQVSEAASLVDGVKVAIAEYHQNRGGFPNSNAEAGLADAESIEGMYVSRVEVGPGGAVVATFSRQAPQKASAAIDGKQLRFTPTDLGDDGLRWDCASDTLPQKACPSSCACQ
jgi:uncharacterized RDD family membrane protein YckC/Tfp pilus assembly protein PilE